MPNAAKLTFFWASVSITSSGILTSIYSTNDNAIKTMHTTAGIEGPGQGESLQYLNSASAAGEQEQEAD